MAVRETLEETAVGHVSYDPGEGETADALANWLEVVSDGLTFDLLGLAPGRSLVFAAPRHCRGFDGATLAGCDAIGIAPGPHLAGAANALPVVRTLLRVGTALARRLPGSIGAEWLPSSTATARTHFLETVEAWLAGGAFPALGLTGFVELRGGGLGTDGMAFFTGQEIELDPALCGDRLAATRLLVRLVDRLVAHSPVRGEARLALETQGTLRLFGAGAVVKISLG